MVPYPMDTLFIGFGPYPVESSCLGSYASETFRDVGVARANGLSTRTAGSMSRNILAIQRELDHGLTGLPPFA